MANILKISNSNFQNHVWFKQYNLDRCKHRCSEVNLPALTLSGYSDMTFCKDTFIDYI